MLARTLLAGLGLAVGLGAAAGCPGHSEGATSGTRRPIGEGDGQVTSPFASIGRVGNQVRGIEAMPDYDREALQVRRQVQPRLPEPLPSPRAACSTMLDTARRYYLDTEGEGSIAVRTMDATREDDLSGCVELTNPAAASCTAIMMHESAGEFPWVLDQCSRAFPTEASGTPVQRPEGVSPG